jgi:hypothetical protein
VTAALAWQQQPGDLQEVNGLSVADALVWYTRHVYVVRLASPDIKMLAIPRGYAFDELEVLSEEQLAADYQRCLQNPRLRLALILGQASGLLALDIDDLAQWQEFLAEHGDLLPPTAMQVTGREGGGLHLLYRRGDVDPALLKQTRWPGFRAIELKTRAPLMAAPSLHDSGRLYQWQPGPGSPALVSTDLLVGFAEGARQDRAKMREIVQGVTRGDRPALEASNAADFTDMLCKMLGGGHFTGCYQRDDKLVIVPRFGEHGYVLAKGAEDDPRKNSPAQIRPLTDKMLQGWAASRCWPYKLVKNRDTEEWEKVHVLPPLAACSAAICADPARWENVPVLSGVVHIPLLRRDGSLLAEPGYDEATGLLYLPLPGQPPVTVPGQPSLADAQAAAARIGMLYGQFGWVSKGDYLNFLAAVLVPPLRLLLPPPWPLWAVNAHERGSGKTLLCETVRILHGGILYAAPGDNSDETRKMITTILGSTTGSAVVLDNAEKVLRSRHFAALVTDPSGMWHDRKLSTNESPGLPNDRAWLLNGNNIALGGDLPRRALWATIDPGVPEPWLRPAGGFTIPDLAGLVTASRVQILADILVLGRYWVLAGRPPGSTARGDSYAAFAAGMSGLMEACGLAAPGEFWAEATNKAADGADDDDWAGFLAAAWQEWGGHQWTAGQLLAHASEALRAALPGDLAGRLARGDETASVAKSLGWWLRNHEGRWTSGKHVVRQAGGGTQGHPKLWRLEHRP